MKTSQKAAKVDFPSTFMQSNMGVKSTRAWKNIDKAVEQYTERHHVECEKFLTRDVPKFEHRTSLRKMIEVNKTLDKSQIECVELMGFGALTNFEIDQLDRAMLKWIIDKYDPESSTLNIRSLMYDVKDEDVKNAIGVPVSSQTITPNATCTDGLKKYGHLFKIVDGRIDIVNLVGSLKQCTSTDDEFKVMYLALLFGTVLFPSTQQNLPVHYLNPLAVIENIKELNWAGLIRSTLNEGIIKWKNKEHTYIGGSLLFLQVFFFAIVRPTSSRYVINLTSERPYLTFLTKHRVSSLSGDMHKDPYWNAKECYFALREISTREKNISFNDLNHVDETKVRTKDVDTHGNGSDDIHGVECEEIGDFSVDLNMLGDDCVHGISPSNKKKAVNKEGDSTSARVLKEDVFWNPRVTPQIENAYDDSYIRNQLSSLSARISAIEKQAKYAHDDFFIRNQLSLFGARLSGVEQQVPQLMKTMDELLNRRSIQPAGGDQFGDQTSCRECVDKFRKELKSLELKIPSIIRDSLDVVCRTTNNAHISSNISTFGQDIDNTVLKKKIEENAMLKKRIEKDTVLKKRVEEDTVLKKKIEEDIVYVYDEEKDVIEKQEEKIVNPEGADFDSIIKFLLDPNLDMR